MFQPRVEPINIDELVHDLKGLNKIFDKCDNSSTSHSFNGVSSEINVDVYRASFIKNDHLNMKTQRKHISASHRKTKTRKMYKKDKYVSL